MYKTVVYISFIAPIITTFIGISIGFYLARKKKSK